jgi:FHA domain
MSANEELAAEPRGRDARTPARTRPLDEAQRGAWLDGPDPVTALRLYDGDAEYELPRKATITLGASRRCDIHIPDLGLSALHCLLERKGSQLRVHDQHTTNGTFYGGHRIDAVELFPGDTFTAAPVTLLAMNDEMLVQRPLIADIVGTDAAPSPDRILVDAVKCPRGFLLTGEPGCDTDRLARAIHAVSLRRTQPLVELAEVPDDRAGQREILRRAARSTLVLDFSRVGAPLDPALCSMLFSRDHRIRMIVLAPAVGVAQRRIPGRHLEQLQHLWVRPLAMRRADIPGLLDRMLAERAAPRRIAELSPRNLQALLAWEWRDNFVGLRAVADRLAAIARVSDWDDLDWRERAAATAIPKSTLYDWLNMLGLTSPLFG